MGIFNAHRAKLRSCGLEGHLKDMNASWKRMSETVAFKNGIAGFIRTTEVTRGKDGDMSTSPLSRSIVGCFQLFLRKELHKTARMGRNVAKP